MISLRYADTTNAKITYLLGAGASYGAVPIWGNQGDSMRQVSRELLNLIDLSFKKNNVPGRNEDYDYLRRFANKMDDFGKKALDFGSIDIYAKRLHLLNDVIELEDLKKCVSVYFDLWESGFLDCSKIENKGKRKYKPIDQRYFSLLSVLLQANDKGPQFHSNVSFITWNYDLQLEKAYETFLAEKATSLSDLNNKVNQNDKERKVIHLNGYRGVYRNEEEEIEIVEKGRFSSSEIYLKEMLRNKDKFDSTSSSFQNSIRYAWEMESDSLKQAKELMKNTNILVIIGYSFPAFNRAIDQSLIKEFEKGTDYKRVIYQDPNANEDIVNSLFRSGVKNVQLEKLNTSQFYIPHEFLSPSKGERFVI